MKKEPKKYIVPVGNDRKLNEEMQDTLRAAGFSGNAPYSSVALSVNVDGDRKIGWHQSERVMYQNHAPCNPIVLNPSYVLTHAHELDGARKLEDTPPEGMKLVTAEQARDYPYPTCDGVMFFDGISRSWIESFEDSGWNGSECASEIKAWAIPADYVFPKPCEIAPEGGKFIDDEILYSGRFFAKYWYINEGCTYWSKSSGVPYRHSGKRYAVPNDFTFEPEVVEMTMAEVCKLAGKKVKIVK